jgi:hypothetical protein
MPLGWPTVGILAPFPQAWSTPPILALARSIPERRILDFTFPTRPGG